MIKPEDNEICKGNKSTGFHHLYRLKRGSEIGEGVVLCADINGTIYLFQVDSKVDVLFDESVPVMEGTLLEYQKDEIILELDYFRVDSCRFPTKEELDWYNSKDTV